MSGRDIDAKHTMYRMITEVSPEHRRLTIGLRLSPDAEIFVKENDLGEFTLHWSGSFGVRITAPDEVSATLFRLAF